jgi:mRNA-degrading endonuclease RelE of RelBE toxin-antitoxin system
MYTVVFSQRAQDDLSALHRLVYSINDEIITVFIVSARGHYNDK